jgi:hypothetical protein
LLGDDNVEIVLGLVDVRAHGYDACYAIGVGFGGPRGRRVPTIKVSEFAVTLN